jgi:peptidoglycan LD-endopeptidase LytH
MKCATWRARLNLMRDGGNGMQINAPTRRRIVLFVFTGLLVIAGAIILMNLVPPRPAPQVSQVKPLPQTTPAPASTPTAPAVVDSANPAAPAAPAAPAVVPLPSAPAADVTPPTGDMAPTSSAPGLVNESDIATLKSKNLLIPVSGVNAGQLRDTFYDGRSEGRMHQALDIMAAGGTPVLAAADGTVARLFQSEKGGITLYQADPSGLYIYYYAHLQRYADGISQGQTIHRGDVIAYVGDTGNAGPGNYHLHFAISKPSAPGKWSGGIPIDPYLIFTGK